MSIHYLPRKRIPFASIKDIGAVGDVHEKVTEQTEPDSNICLTDGKNYLWATKSVDNKNTTFSSWGLSDASMIIEFLEERFSTAFVSDMDEENWRRVSKQYPGDYITIQLPTDANPGP
jgi:hypothetical protein